MSFINMKAKIPNTIFVKRIPQSVKRMIFHQCCRCSVWQGQCYLSVYSFLAQGLSLEHMHGGHRYQRINTFQKWFSTNDWLRGRSWVINISVPSSLRWDNSEICAYNISQSFFIDVNSSHLLWPLV